MPTEPTVDEVRKLLEELPESWDAHKGYCLSQAAARTVVTLCRHFLDNPMTAGEFAGLVVGHFEKLKDDCRLRLKTARGQNSKNFYIDGIEQAEWAIKRISGVASMRNITIVESKK